MNINGTKNNVGKILLNFTIIEKIIPNINANNIIKKNDSKYISLVSSRTRNGFLKNSILQKLTNT